MSNNKGAWVAALRWPQVQQRIAQGATALLPIGAGSKEHGPHLPMNTDQLQAEWFSEQLLQQFPLLAWPTISYGYYPAFIDYPGSSHLREPTFTALVSDIIDGISQHGVSRIILLNTGISTIDVLEKVAQQRTGVSLINVYSGPRCRAVCTQLLGDGDGGHADERETSLLLAIAPQRVNMPLAPGRDQTNIASGPLQWRDPQAANYSPSGIIGDARGAAKDKGQQILAAIMQDLTGTIAQLLNG